VDDIAPGGDVETLVVDAGQTEYEADVARLRDEGLVVDEAPRRQQAVDASGLLVVADDAREPQHDRTSTSNRLCLTASYRARNRDEDSRIRNISGSRFVAHHANA